MMRSMIVGIFAVLSLSAQAAVMETRIAGVDAPAGEKKVMILAETEGRVLWVNATEKVLVKAFSIAAESAAVLKVTYNVDSGMVESAQTLSKTLEESAPALNEQKVDEYYPTVFRSRQEAQTYFNTMDNQTKDDSQCYNRAHGWAYDLFNQYRINSLKIFLFFTRRYIREYDYKWWFHVSPMTLVGDRGYNTEYVIDRSFTQGPVEVQAWTNIFMKNRVQCPQVRFYSQYSQNQEAQYCYVMKTIMYYSTPRDLEWLETRNRYETDWNMEELRTGRRQAFINWQRYNP